MKLNEQAAEMQKLMGEINDLLKAAGADPLAKSMPLKKDDEQGGIDDNAEGDESKPMEMDGAPAPGPDASGEASEGAEEEAAADAADDLGDLDGEGDDGMDGRAEVEAMVADMSDDELMLMLEVLQAESAARGAGEEGGEADAGEEMAPEGEYEAEPEMDAGEPALEESEDCDPEMMKSEDLSKARVDEGKSDQRKATARAARNDRQLSSPKGTLKRDHQFYEKKGAMPGRKGESVVGEPKAAEKGVHAGGEKDKWSHNLPDGPEKSASVSHAGVKARWDKANAAKGRSSLNIGDSAKEMHQKKLGELKDMNKSEEKDDDKDEMKKSIQQFIEKADQFFAAQQAPVQKPVVIVAKPIASNRPQGQALEKSSSVAAPQKLEKSKAISMILDVQRKEQDLLQKSVDSGVVSDLHRASDEVAEKMILDLQVRGILPK